MMLNLSKFMAILALMTSQALASSEIRSSNNNIYPSNIRGSLRWRVEQSRTKKMTARHRQLQAGNSSPVPAQTFYVPLPEHSLLYDTFVKINDDSTGPVHSLISMTISTTGTVVWYDHWEDGYESNVVSPSTTTTEIWGDGNASNGCAPSVKDCTDDKDILTAGDSIIMDNKVSTDDNRDLTDIKYDGGDRIDVSFPVAVTRGAFPDDPGSYMAGAVEVLAVSFWGTEYMIPAGEDTVSETDAFDVTAVYLQACEDNTTVSLPTGQVMHLNRGESGYLQVPHKAVVVTSDKPIQVDLVSGDDQSHYELRWFTLRPTYDWSREYVSPVGDSKGMTKVLLFNPHDTPLSVTYQYLNNGTVGDIVTETVDIPPKDSVFSVTIPDGSGVRFQAEKTYIALSLSDTVAHGQLYDWGFPVVPIEFLTPIVLIGMGYGCKELDCGNKGNSRNVVFVTPVDEADIYVDFNNDGVIDETFSDVQALQGIIIKEEGDDDTSGAIIWATAAGSGPDGPPVNMAAAYGQSARESYASDYLALDLGTVVLPFSGISASKTAELVADNDDNGWISPGDEIEYTIKVSNVGQVDLPAGTVTIQDVLDSHVSYVPGTTKYLHENGLVAISDNDSGTAFPLDGSGITNQANLPRRGGTHEITFRVLIDSDNMSDVPLIYNAGTASASGMTADFECITPLPREERNHEVDDKDDEEDEGECPEQEF